MRDIINATIYTFSRLTSEKRKELGFTSTKADRKRKKIERQNRRKGRR